MDELENKKLRVQAAVKQWKKLQRLKAMSELASEPIDWLIHATEINRKAGAQYEVKMPKPKQSSGHLTKTYKVPKY